MHILLLGKMIFTKEIFTAFHQLINIDSRTTTQVSSSQISCSLHCTLHLPRVTPGGTPECAGEVWGGTKSGEVG